MSPPVDGISNHYIPAQGYSNKRQLEAPRVNVPVDLTCRDGKHTFQTQALPFSPSSQQYGNPAFLRALAGSHTLDVAHSMLTWQYEMRRTGHAILPFLFLGPSSVAKDPTFLKNNGITLLVAARSSRMVRDRTSFIDPATFPSSAGLATWTFDFDQPADFISSVRPTIRAINQHLEASCAWSPIQDVQDVRAKVLIFCETGNDRSALLAAAYLVIVYGVDAFTAIHIVQAQRFSINLSDNVKNVLLTLQGIVEAERQVSDTNAAMVSSPPVPNNNGGLAYPARNAKRNIDECTTSDDDEMVDVSDNEASPRVRAGVAPFADIID